MNYYKQVAEMLGVELNEEFSLKHKDGSILKFKYKITEFSGLLFKGIYEWMQSGDIDKIISGDLTIVKLPWKPKEDEFYYYYSPYCGITCQERWMNTSSDYCMWKIGNCFRTREEASKKGKEIMEPIEKEYRES